MLKSISLLGRLPSTDEAGCDEFPTILIIQKTPFDTSDPSKITSLFSRVEVIEENDIVRIFIAILSAIGRANNILLVFLGACLARRGRTHCAGHENQCHRPRHRPPYPKGTLTIISKTPCALHPQQYSAQKRYTISETPDLYRSVTQPYIAAIPPSRTQWQVRCNADHNSNFLNMHCGFPGFATFWITSQKPTIYYSKMPPPRKDIFSYRMLNGTGKQSVLCI